MNRSNPPAAVEKAGRWIVFALMGVSLVAVPQLATAAGHGASACQRLHGADLAPARTIKLVERRGAGWTRLVGCALPRGRVRTLGSSDGGSFGDFYAVRAVAGAFVLLDQGYGSSDRTEERTSVVNIRTGRSHRIASLVALTGGATAEPSAHTTAPAAFINARGEAAAAVRVEPTQAGSPVRIVIAGFSATGRRTTLDEGSPDEIAVDSLRLRGRTVTWTHAGQPRQANVPGHSLPPKGPI